VKPEARKLASCAIFSKVNGFSLLPCCYVPIKLFAAPSFRCATAELYVNVICLI
jgi:hypothetical protein